MRLKTFRARADSFFTMSPRTRLDSAVKLHEQREGRALEEMAEANRKLADAEAELAGARVRAHQDGRVAGRAAEWQLAESAHGRALAEVNRAQRDASQALAAAGTTRSQYVAAYSRAESLRRAAASRRAEIVRDLEKAEERALDDLGLMTRARNQAA